MAIEVGAAFVSIVPSFKGFGREVAKQLNAETAGIGKTAGEKISKDIGGGLKKAGSSTAEFGNKVTRNVTLPITGAGALAFKAFGDFDQTMRQVGVQTGLTGDGLAEFNRLALKMGADTSFSAGQAADAMLELAKGGLTAAQIKGGALQQTLTLAAAGGVSLGDAAGTLANTLNTFGLKAADAGKVAAALAGGANASTASVGSLSQAMAQVGPGAKLLGLSLNDTVAALAAFDNAGIKGSDAGTSLKTMLQRLSPQTDSAANQMQALGLASFSSQKAMALLRQNGIKPLGSDQKTLTKQLTGMVAEMKGVKPDSAAAEKAFQKLANSNKILGNSFFDASGKAKPLGEIAQTLQDSMKGLTKEQQQNALTTIFGADSYRAAAVLAQNGATGIGKMKAATQDLSAAQKLAKTNTDGAKGSVEQLKGSVETAAIQIGTIMAPAVTDLVGDLTKLVNKFGELDPQTQKVAIAGAGLVAAFGPVTSALGNTVESIGKTVSAAKTVGSGMKTAATGTAGFVQGLKNGQSGLSAFAGPAQRAGSFINRGLVTGFTAVRGPMVAAATAMKAFTLSLLANPIGIAVVAIVALVGVGVLLYKKWTPFRTFIDNLWAGIKSLAATIATTAVAAFHSFMGVLGQVWAAVQRGWTVFTQFLAVATRVFLAVANVITQPIQGIIGVLQGIWNIIAGIFTGNLSRIGTGVAQAIGGIVRFFFGMPARIIMAILPLLPRIWAFMVSVFVRFKAAVVAGATSAIAWLKTVPGKAAAAISALASLLMAKGRAALTALRNAVVAGASAVVAYIKGFPGRFVSGMAALGSMLSSAGKRALSLLHTAVTVGATNVVTYIKGLPGRIVSGLGNLGSTLSSAGRDVLSGFISGIRSMAGNVISAIRDTITDKIPGYVKKALGIASPSKVFAQIGRWTVEGLRRGIVQTGPKAVEAARKLAVAVTDATNRAMRKANAAQDKLLRARRDSALKSIKTTMAALAPKLAQRDALNTQIAATTKSIASMKAAKERVRASLSEQLNKSRDLFGGALDGILPTPQAIADRLAQNLKKIRTFASLLRTLTAKGFGTAIIEQIASQGADAGMHMAQVMATSTPAQVKAINQQYAAIGTETTKVANDISGRMYNSGIAAAEGLLAGLKSKKAALEKAMVSLSDALVRSIEKRLKIASPSKVFKGVGDNIGAGLEVGVAGRATNVHKAIDGLVKQPNPNALVGRADALAYARNPNVRVFIGDQELTHIVRTEVDDAQDNLGRQLTYGRRA